MIDGYEWDERKRRANLLKHGVDFTSAEGFLWRYATIVEDMTLHHDEYRFVSIGPIGDRLFTMVWTDGDEDRIRIISLRPATSSEKKQHAKEFRN